MNKMNKKRRNLFKDTSGSTITEVVVAFVIVMMALAIFSQITVFSENMMVKYDDSQKGYQEFNEDFYKKDGAAGKKGSEKKVDDISFYIVPEDDPSGRLPLTDAGLYYYEEEADKPGLYYMK